MKKSRLLDSPTIKRNSLRVNQSDDINSPLSNGTLIPFNNYISDQDAIELEHKRIANIFLRLPCSYNCENIDLYPDIYN